MSLDEPMNPRRPFVSFLKSYALLVIAAFLALQLYFLLRIISLAYIYPVSTAFERSEAWRIANLHSQVTPDSVHVKIPWLQEWRPSSAISANLKRAVIASEDTNFTTHFGVEWSSIERAWNKNVKAEELAQTRAKGSTKNVKIVGGSTITQQLAKNLFLSKERHLFRKAQELLITLELEAFVPKTRILELYLNNVEWGAGVFGAEAASRHYFSSTAARLTPNQCARLAVMLPRPKFFERNLGSPYLADRAEVIEARLNSARVP